MSQEIVTKNLEWRTPRYINSYSLTSEYDHYVPLFLEIEHYVPLYYMTLAGYNTTSRFSKNPEVSSNNIRVMCIIYVFVCVGSRDWEEGNI